jgi:hypothetical protein
MGNSSLPGNPGVHRTKPSAFPLGGISIPSEAVAKASIARSPTMVRLPRKYFACLWLVLAAGICDRPPWTLGSPTLEASPNFVWKTRWFRAELGTDARWASLRMKASGRELVAPEANLPIAEVTLLARPEITMELVLGHAPLAKVLPEGKKHPAAKLEQENGRYVLSFSGCDTQLVYTVQSGEEWMEFRLEEIRGPRPVVISLLQIPVLVTEKVGTRLNAAWDRHDAICLMAGTAKTEAKPAVRQGFTILAARSQDFPGPRLEGCSAVLVAVPQGEVRRVLREVSVAFDLPRNEHNGVPSKELPAARESYWFLSFGEKDVDRVIELCRQTGFRQVFISSGAWCLGPGHYPINTAFYPEGLESLRRTISRLHEHGILVGMHTYASKVSKRDPYVTPVPDKRFLVVAQATLAEDIDVHSTTIRVREDLRDWPGSPLCPQKLWEGGIRKHQEVVIDDEIIQYESIGPEGRWDTLLGCRRGAWGTQAAPHSAGTVCHRYAVDGCIDGYIIDQETSLFEEVTSRLAELFDTCDFDMIYFDGSEDVDTRRFDYYAALAHARVMQKIRKRPVIHQGGGFHHYVWHSFTRSGTVDTYLSTIHGYLIAGGTLARWPAVRDHIDRSVRYVESLEADLIPGELGWFGIWPKTDKVPGLQLDEIEYLMAKSLALNAPISFQTSFSQMDKHGLTSGILEIARTYELLRRAGVVPEDLRQQLRTLGVDFALFYPQPATEGTVPEFIPVEPLAGREQTAGLRAMLGPRAAGSILLFWHEEGKAGRLALPAVPLEVRDIQGQLLPVEEGPDQTKAIPGGSRRIAIYLPGMPPGQVAALWHQARWEEAHPE